MPNYAQLMVTKNAIILFQLRPLPSPVADGPIQKIRVAALAEKTEQQKRKIEIKM